MSLVSAFPIATRRPWGLALLLLLLATPARAAVSPQVVVRGGAVRAVSEHEIAIWANSPQASVTLMNPSGGYYRTSLRWFNVPVGAYMVSPHGVADAASLQGGSLVGQLVLHGGGSTSRQLESNLKGGYRFAVTGGDLAGLSHARQAGELQFALHLGNSGLGMGSLLQALARQPFPTYLLPGSRDRASDFRQFAGEARRDFAVGRDHFLFLDNSRGVLGRSQVAWATDRFRSFHAEGAHRIFVFTHFPIVDPRPGHRRARRETRALQRLFREGGVTMAFASHAPVARRAKWQGIDYFVAGGGHAWVVQVHGDDVTARDVP